VTGTRSVLRPGGSGVPTRDHYVALRFSTGRALDGTLDVHLVEAPVSADFAERVTRGQVVPLVHLPEDPTVFEVDPGRNAGNALAAWIMAGFFGVMGFGISGLAFRRASTDTAFLRHGIPVAATVTAITETGIFRLIRFRVDAPDGTTLDATSRGRSPAMVKGVEPGMRFRARLLPGPPPRAMLEGDLPGHHLVLPGVPGYQEP
jgi:hypothetical protein